MHSPPGTVVVIAEEQQAPEGNVDVAIPHCAQAQRAPQCISNSAIARTQDHDGGWVTTSYWLGDETACGAAKLLLISRRSGEVLWGYSVKPRIHRWD